MKRFLLYITGGVASLIVAALCVGPLQVSALERVNNFTITNFQIDYHLGRDSEGRSVLKTTETITANFRQRNVNHGLERAIPTDYDKHSVGLTIDSVTDGSGAPLPYSNQTGNGNTVIRIGDPDSYVYGTQTYVLTYTQHDVTKAYSDTHRDEFYWDTNGTQWRVPISRLGVTVRMDESLAARYQQGMCYTGAEGSSARCAIDISKQDGTLRIYETNLARGENVTLALGFSPQTFASYEPSVVEKLFKVWILIMIATSIAAIAVIVWMSVRWSRLYNRKKELGTIIPEYLPPQGYSVLTSARMVSTVGSVLAAQLIDFAVRHYIRIYQQTEQKTLISDAKYRIELTKSPEDLTTEEQSLLKIFFPTNSIGETFEIDKLQRNASMGLKIQKAIYAPLGKTYKLRERVLSETKSFRRIAWIVLLLSIVTLAPLLFLAALVGFILSATLKPLTDEGLRLRRYLLGLKYYISVAEQDRLSMLQSPDGAEKTGVTLRDGGKAELVKLYERVLPYAVLFNQETEWSRQLGKYYESTQQQPGWYSGRDVFSAAVLSSAISSFGVAATPYVASSSSSSSGGSSGGGFSGGGGGGGGGGGW